jgi:hypothetical protein
MKRKEAFQQLCWGAFFFCETLAGHRPEGKTVSEMVLKGPALSQ